MKSELLWLSLTTGIVSPVRRSIPAISDSVPGGNFQLMP